MNLPKAVKYVIKTIMKNGGQVYLVGGALRDHLLGKPVTDYDIAVSLLPNELSALFSNHRSWPTGKRFGTITLEVYGMNIEITTFRQESLYTDSRHPDEVTFVPDIRLDLARRDFTINAMAWNPFSSQGIIDPFHGEEDLNQSIIQTVGSPYERFIEDPLRIMRGIRFSAQLDFQLHTDTKKAMTICSQQLLKVSAERLRDELNKLILSPHPDKGLLELQDIRALQILFPLIDETAQNTYPVLNHQNVQIINSLPLHLALRLASFITLLFEENFDSQERIGLIKDSLYHLKYDKKTINHIIKLVMGYHNFLSMKATPYYVRKLLGQLGTENTRYVLNWISTAYASEPSMPKINKQIKKITEANTILCNVLKNNDPVYFVQLALNGKDIIDTGIGVKNPKMIGEALKLAYEWILENPEWNRTDYLISKLKNHYEL